MFERLGKFDIKCLLGSGAMGEVYLGVDPAIGREVAIKTILPIAAEELDMKERFAREARAAGTLNHPNIVTVYEFGEDQGVLYLAMEYVPGADLEELITNQELSRTDILEVLAQVCDGLDYAHRRQIVHRDIKPANIRVDRDGRRLHTRVMDFGVARMGSSDMTATGIVMGTVSYMAPEYIQSGRLDARSDLFSVGVMLYEALSGRKPFAGATATTVLYKIVNEIPPPLDYTHFEGISPAIRQVLDQGLAKDPDQRFQSAEAFGKALRAAKNPTWQGAAHASTAAAMLGSIPVLPPTGIEPSSRERPPFDSPRMGNATPPASHSQAWPGWLAAALVMLLAGLGLAWNAKRVRHQGPPTTASIAVGETKPFLEPAVPSRPLPPVQPASPTTPLDPKAPLPSTGGESSLGRQARVASNDSAEVHVLESSHEEMSIVRTYASDASKTSEAMKEGSTSAQRQKLVDTYAGELVLMYRQGRFSECRDLFRQVRQQGLGPRLRSHPAVQQILSEERAHPKVPGGLDHGSES